MIKRHMYIRALLVLALAASSHGPGSHAQDAPMLARTGQEFADLVADWGRRDHAHMTILLPGPGTTSLQGVNITAFSALVSPGHTPYSSGSLTVQASADPTSTVFDAAYQTGFGPFSGSAKLFLQGFSMINMCEQTLVLNTIPGKPIYYHTSLGVSLFNKSRFISSHVYTNLTIYGRQADLGVYAYIKLFQSTPFTALVDLAWPIVGAFPSTQASVLLRTEYALVAKEFVLASATGRNVTFASINNQGDPVIAAMRAAGTLRPPRFCNGSLVPQSMVTAKVDPIAPLWLTADTLAWVAALQEAIKLGAEETPTNAFRGPPCVLLSGTALLSAVPLLPAYGPLHGPLLLAGPPIESRRDPQIFTQLDLGGWIGLLTLRPGARLYLQYMVLTGFAQRPLPLAPGSPTRTPPLSAFPLAAFSPPASEPNTLHIGLANVTMLLPTNDFLALLTLALEDKPSSISGCVGESVLAHAEALRTDISVLVASDFNNADPVPGVILYEFVGWGVNATNIFIRPEGQGPQSFEARLVLYQSCPRLLGMYAAPGSTGTSKGVTAGVIVGCVVGGAVGGALLCGLAMAWVLQKRKAKECAHNLGGRSSSNLDAEFPKANTERDTNSTTVTVGDGQGDSTSHAAGSQELYGLRRPDMWAVPGSIGLAQAVSEMERALGIGLCPAEGRQPLVWQGHKHQQTQHQQPQHQQLHEIFEHLQPHSEQQQQQQPGVPSALNQHWQQQELEQKQQEQEQKQHNEQLLLQKQQEQELQQQRAQQRAHGHGKEQQEQPKALQKRKSSVLASGVSCEWLDQTHQSDSLQDLETPARSVGPTSGGMMATAMSSPNATDPLQQVEQLAGEIRMGDMNKVVVHGIVGRGAWGLVFRGEWRGLPVALKTMVFSGSGHDQNPSGAIMEAALAASLGHRNVVVTYHWDIQPLTECLQDEAGQGQSGSLQIHMAFNNTTSMPGAAASLNMHGQYKLFLVQELCALCLSKALSQGLLHQTTTGRAQEEFVYGLLCDIASGLQYMHGRNVIHGDLKPGNVLLKADMSSTNKLHVVAKLADFGLSARMTAEATHVSGFSSGTPYYVAPEVIHEYRTSTASDMWSFGVLMWQMYSGSTPYLVDAAGAYMANPAFPEFDPNKIPHQAYLQLLHWCLQRDPHKRPTAAQALAVLSRLNNNPSKDTRPQQAVNAKSLQRMPL